MRFLIIFGLEVTSYPSALFTSTALGTLTVHSVEGLPCPSYLHTILKEMVGEARTVNVISQLGRGTCNVNALLLNAGVCASLRQQSAAYASSSGSVFCLCNKCQLQRTAVMPWSQQQPTFTLCNNKTARSSKPA